MTQSSDLIKHIPDEHIQEVAKALSMVIYMSGILTRMAAY